MYFRELARSCRGDGSSPEYSESPIEPVAQMWGNHPGKPFAKYPSITEKLVARRASSMFSRWLSEAIPPERDAKSDVSGGIISEHA